MYLLYTYINMIVPIVPIVENAEFSGIEGDS